MNAANSPSWGGTVSAFLYTVPASGTSNRLPGVHMSPQKIFAPAALLALMGLAPGVQAQSLNLYGVIDLAFGSFQNSYAETADNPRVTKLDSNPTITSFFGMKGTEDLGGGVKAGFMLESFLRPDTGASGRSSADVTAPGNAPPPPRPTRCRLAAPAPSSGWPSRAGGPRPRSCGHPWPARRCRS